MEEEVKRYEKAHRFGARDSSRDGDDGGGSGFGRLGFSCTGIETSRQAQEAIKTIKAESRGQGGLTDEQKAQVEALKQLRQQLKKQGL